MPPPPPAPVINILISRTWAYVSIDGKRDLQNPRDLVVNNLQMQRRQWHPTPVLLPGKSMDRGAWWAAVHGVAKSRAWLSDFTFTFPFHALEKEMAAHSSVLAWRIPGVGKSGGLLSMGLHRVGHNWSDLAAAATFRWRDYSWLSIWDQYNHIGHFWIVLSLGAIIFTFRLVQILFYNLKVGYISILLRAV